MLSLAHNFLFIHVPKTAGNSITRALLPFSEDKIVRTAPHQDGMERFEIRSPSLEMHKHLTLAEYRERLSSEQFDRLFKFCGIRNPWDRCVSYFFSPHRGDVEWSPTAFEAFIKETILPIDHYIRYSGDQIDPFENVDAVLRFEHLHRDFTLICEKIGVGEFSLPKVNVGRHRRYQEYYVNEDLIELVATKFKMEIERFGYEFE